MIKAKTLNEINWKNSDLTVKQAIYPYKKHPVIAENNMQLKLKSDFKKSIFITYAYGFDSKDFMETNPNPKNSMI